MKYSSFVQVVTKCEGRAQSRPLLLFHVLAVSRQECRQGFKSFLVTNYTILTVTNYTIFVTSIHAFYFSEVLYSVLLMMRYQMLDILVWFQSLLDIFIFIYKVLMLPIWLNNWINCCWVKEFSNPNRNNPLVVLLSGLIFFLLLFFFSKDNEYNDRDSGWILPWQLNINQT